jgi:hypothetical protein
MGGGDGLLSQDFPFTMGGHTTVTTTIMVGTTDR